MRDGTRQKEILLEMTIIISNKLIIIFFFNKNLKKKMYLIIIFNKIFNLIILTLYIDSKYI